MHVTYVCTDPGVPVFGAKGASVHARAVLGVLADRGVALDLHAARIDGVRPAGLGAVVVHEHGRPRGSTAAERERAAVAADDRMAARLADAGPTDLVYERYALWGGAGVRTAARRGVPSILEVNAPLIDEQARHRTLVDRAGAEERARATFAAATTVVCVSDDVADWVRRRTDRHDRVRTVPNGVDVDRVRPGDARDPDAFTVGFVGTVRPWHGVDALIRAVAVLRRSVPAARVLLVGDGPDLAAVLALAADLGVPVEHTGQLDPDDVPAELHRFDVATVPTPGEDGQRYFSPLKLFEYLAAGLPVVATDVGQTAELLRTERAGLLVPAGDDAAFAAALRTVATRPAVAGRLRRRARNLATTRLTWTRTVGRSLAAAGLELPPARSSDPATAADEPGDAVPGDAAQGGVAPGAAAPGAAFAVAGREAG